MTVRYDSDCDPTPIAHPPAGNTAVTNARAHDVQRPQPLMKHPAPNEGTAAFACSSRLSGLVMLTSPQPPQPAGASLWPAALILWGRGTRSAPHSHHCIQVYLALSGTVRARSGSGTRWQRCTAVLVAPDMRHAIDASEGPVLIGFFDPGGGLPASVWAWVAGGVTVVAGAGGAGWRAILGGPTEIDKARVDRWVHSELLRERRPWSLHPGVVRVLNLPAQRRPAGAAVVGRGTSPTSRGCRRHVSCTCLPNRSAFRFGRTSAGFAFSVRWGRSPQDALSQKRLTSQVSRMRRISLALSVGPSGILPVNWSRLSCRRRRAMQALKESSVAERGRYDTRRCDQPTVADRDCVRVTV